MACHRSGGGVPPPKIPPSLHHPRGLPAWRAGKTIWVTLGLTWPWRDELSKREAAWLSSLLLGRRRRTGRFSGSLIECLLSVWWKNPCFSHSLFSYSNGESNGLVVIFTKQEFRWGFSNSLILHYRRSITDALNNLNDLLVWQWYNYIFFSNNALAKVFWRSLFVPYNDLLVTVL